MPETTEKNYIWQFPAVIALVALAMRLVAIRFFYHNTYNSYENHLLFGFETGRIARSIAEGHGYGNPLYVETGPTAWMTPVYPYLLAAVFKVFGVYSRTSALFILGLNSLFSALVCIPVFFIARRSFGRSPAVLASWLWAFYPYSIYISSSFVWETCLSALLVVLLFLYVLFLKENTSAKNLFGFGALCGFSALTNASTLTLCPVLAGWALYPSWRNQRRWLKFALLIATGLVVVLLPWQVRNYRTFHSSIPLRDNFWLEFWIGNDGHTESWTDNNAHPSINPAQKTEFGRLGEIPYMREKRREAVGFLAQHPGLYLVQCVRRFVFLWTGFWSMDPANLQDEFQGFANVYLTLVLTATMLIGVWFGFRNAPGSALPFLLVLLFYPLLFYLTHPAIRYRHVIDPEILMLSALGVKALLSKPGSLQATGASLSVHKV